MNDIVKVLIEHGAEFAILDPAIKAARAGGVELLKDWVGPDRLDEIRRALNRAGEILKRRKVEPKTPPLSVLLPILEAAQDESRDELRELWASLLAAAADPTRSHIFRREFIEVVKGMEPLDSLVLSEVANPRTNPSTWRNEAVAALKREEDQVLMAAQNLARLGCIEPQPNHRIENNALITPKGRQLLAVLAN